MLYGRRAQSDTVAAALERAAALSGDDRERGRQLATATSASAPRRGCAWPARPPSVNKLFGLDGDKWMRLEVVSGPGIPRTAKAWFIDRMVLLFEHMKDGNLTYAAWEY